MPRVLVPVKPAALGAPLVRIAADGQLEPAPEHQLDPIDELALEWAASALEAGAVSAATAVSIGAAPALVALRAARSRGCPELLRIDPGPVRELDLDVATVARLLAAAARRTEATIVALGSESYDGSGGVVPGAVAAALGWSLVSRARELALGDDALDACCATGDGTQQVAVALPAVVSFGEGAIVPRNPRLSAVIAARRAEVAEVAAGELLDGRPGRWSAGVRAVEVVPPRPRASRVVTGDEGIHALLAAAGAARGDQLGGGR